MYPPGALVKHNFQARVFSRTVYRTSRKNGEVKQVKRRGSNHYVSTKVGVSDEPIHVVVAGGGLGGLFLAICLIRAGLRVTVLEKTNEYKPLGGPIQLASNGVGVVQAVSEQLLQHIQSVSRPFWSTTSGIKDGMTGEWMFTFDAITQIPEQDDLPFSLCVDRCDLQRALLDEIDRISDTNQIVRLGACVDSFAQSNDGVSVILTTGERVTGDVLVGADGIWSKVRSQLFDEPCSSIADRFSVASYTGFKLFSGLPLYSFSEYFDIGYSAFIGPDHYFVVCPDRFGRTQWYAFVKSDPLTGDVQSSKEFLIDIFRDWAPEIRNLIESTDEEEMVQRYLLDRKPSIEKGWSTGCVTLLGDSCHATMPNIGQGTGLAFEDAFVLTELLSQVDCRSQLPGTLQEYYKKRILRTATVQGLGRINSEAIKLLTPLLPVRSLVDFVLTPVLPLVFNLQFQYCYSFCPVGTDRNVSKITAETMRRRHEKESRDAWTRGQNSSKAL